MSQPAGARFTVDPWDPGYGQAVDELDGGALAASTAELDLDLERPTGRWGPVDPDLAPPLPGTVLFLDGVRRVDARIWLHGRGPQARAGSQPAPGLAASLAAGLVSCDGDLGSAGGSCGPPPGTPRAGTAKVAEVTVERGLFTAAPDAADIAGRHARYPVRMAQGPGPDMLALALQQRLGAAEVQLALAFRARYPDADDLLVVDGPLRGRTHLDRTVGYIKTHHAPELPPAAAIGLADLTARLLPPLASTPHKDPRAPQNLVPIGGLERELRRRLGDQQLLYRTLRAAATAG